MPWSNRGRRIITQGHRRQIKKMHTLGFTPAYIADVLRLNRETVKSHIRKHYGSGPSNQWSEQEVEELVKCVERGMPIAQVARRRVLGKRSRSAVANKIYGLYGSNPNLAKAQWSHEDVKALREGRFADIAKPWSRAQMRRKLVYMKSRGIPVDDSVLNRLTWPTRWTDREVCLLLAGKTDRLKRTKDAVKWKLRDLRRKGVHKDSTVRRASRSRPRVQRLS